MNFCMAGSNAYGLLLCTVMLGYGLVEYPRSLWYYGGVKTRLTYLEFYAARWKDEAFDAESGSCCSLTKNSLTLAGTWLIARTKLELETNCGRL